MSHEEQTLALAPVMPPRVIRAATWLIYPIFFGSGMAGLIYEIVWTRRLLYVFGSGLYAVTAVLTAFMAGLALGSLVLGRASDRLRFPLRFYAMMEIAIGTAGFALPWLMGGVNAVDAWAYPRVGENFAALTALRFAVSFLILLIPTTFMGATLPIMTKALTRREERLGLSVGLLYAINTAGAVAGAALAGFYLIGRFGVDFTEYAAAALNFTAATGAYLISTIIETPSASDVNFEPAAASNSQPDVVAIETPADSRARRAALVAVFGSGVVAMGAQVIWSRSLVFSFEYLKNTTYAFSAMLAVFLTGLALGGALGGLIIDRQRNPLRLYGVLLALTGVSILYSVHVIHWGAGASLLPSPLMADGATLDWPRAVANIFTQSALAIFIPTLLMGMAFPAVVKSVAPAGGLAGIGGWVGRLYAVNTLGSVIGPIAACFVLIPVIGLTRGICLLGVLEVALGLYAVYCSSSKPVVTVGLAGFFALACCALIAKMPAVPLQWLEPGHQLIHYDEGPMATVAVVQNTLGYRTIDIDGVGVAGTDPMLQTDQKSLAHVGTLLADNPKAALTVGFGSGGASYSFLQHAALVHVDCVEILRETPKAAPHLKDANHGLLELNDPRYRIIYEDARAYLRHTDRKYDVIATDCTDLRYKSNANLYDVEYFQFCRERLSPGGLVVVWMPLGGLSDDMFRVALRTFHHVFPAIGVMFMNNEPTHYILLLGWADQIKIDFARMAERMAAPKIRADLAELNLDDPVKLISCWVTGGEPLSKWLAGDVYNTEGFPVLEFQSPKFGYGDRPVIENLAGLTSVRNSPREFMASGPPSAADAARLEKYEAAAPIINEGHAHYRRIELEDAGKDYARALAIAPDDRALQALLNFRELRQTAKIGGGNAFASFELAKIYHNLNRVDEAADAYRETIRLSPKNLNPATDEHRQKAEKGLADLIAAKKAAAAAAPSPATPNQ